MSQSGRTALGAALVALIAIATWGGWSWVGSSWELTTEQAPIELGDGTSPEPARSPSPTTSEPDRGGVVTNEPLPAGDVEDGSPGTRSVGGRDPDDDDSGPGDEETSAGDGDDGSDDTGSDDDGDDEQSDDDDDGADDGDDDDDEQGDDADDD